MHHLESFGIHIPELYQVPLAIRGYGVQLELRKSLQERFSTTLVADSLRSWSGVRRGLGPELDPIATVRVAKTNKRLAKANPAPSQGAPFPPPAGVDSQREKAAKSERQNEELIRQLRSLGYIR